MSGRPSRTAARRLAVTERPRLRRLRASHSYGLVLALVLAAFLFALVAPNGSWANGVLVVLQALTVACALWTAGITGVHAPRYAAMGALALGAAVTSVEPGGRIAGAAAALFAGVLCIAVVVVIGIGVIDQGEANQDSISGAIAIYVQLGLLFTFAYSALAALGHGAFFAEGTDGTRALRTYFSYVTLATLGYGDYTAAGTLGHALAVFEALFGQLYLVTVVALLVSRLQRRDAGSKENGDRLLIPPG